jgi:hypothetical protein
LPETFRQACQGGQVHALAGFFDRQDGAGVRAPAAARRGEQLGVGDEGLGVGGRSDSALRQLGLRRRLDGSQVHDSRLASVLAAGSADAGHNRREARDKRRVSML